MSFFAHPKPVIVKKIIV